MEQERRERLFESIRKDDRKAFEAFVPEVFFLSFGRFPILSLLYLYDAKRIIKQHFTELIKERPRSKEEPFRLADRLFAERAGKCLRYYTSSEVSPLEMLAVLGRRRELKRVYSRYPNASRILPKIHRVYFTRLGVGVSVKGDQLSLPVEPFSYGEKRSWMRMALLFLALFVMVASLTVFSVVYYGTGSEGSYFRARSASATKAALARDSYISLQSDITLSTSIESYSSDFDGGNHIIRLHAPFAEKLTGELRDVIFVVEEDFVGEALILENEGRMKNVRVVAEGLTLSRGKEYMGLLTSVNRGLIEGCSVIMRISIEGDGINNCYFAPLVGENEGEINDCLIDGSIYAKDIDIVGVVSKNGEKGVITDCVVKADFSEISDQKSWNPTVAGVTAENEGTIYHAVVSGKVESAFYGPMKDITEETGEAYAAGIAIYNGGTIRACENLATVTATAENDGAIAAGIVLFNTNKLSDTFVLPGTLESSKNRGEVSAIAKGSDAYAAGIAAFNFYIVSECRNIAPVTARAEKGDAFAGGIIARNSYTHNTIEYFMGEMTTCVGEGIVTAESMTSYAYVGGIAAENYGKIYSCGQTAAITATTENADKNELIGGIVGANYGAVSGCFFIGTLPDYDENTFVGGICGLIGVPYPRKYVVEENYYVAGEHTSGSMVLTQGLFNLESDVNYGVTFFENDERYFGFIEEFLDYGAEKVTAEEIKEKEIYYE